MNSTAAFKFIGKLSDSTIRCARHINSGNAVCACIDAGVALIDMTSSIIQYSNECKRTDLLRKQVYESKVLLDLMVEQEKRNAEIEIEKANQILIRGLDKLKLELSKEYEVICLGVEQQKNKLSQDMEFDRERNEIFGNVRLMIKDSLTISTDALEVLNRDCDKNKSLISGFEEQIRLAAANYYKMIKLCC